MRMYALFLLIAVAAFGLWFGLSRLFEHLDRKKRPDDTSGGNEQE